MLELVNVVESHCHLTLDLVYAKSATEEGDKYTDMQESSYGTLMRSFSHPKHNILAKFAHFVSEAKVKATFMKLMVTQD